MVPTSRSGGDRTEAAAVWRHRRVPMRTLGEKLIVARPRDGAPVVMEANAVVVWRCLDDWATADEMDRRLAEAYPAVAASDRSTARTEILGMLQDDDLVERG
jgi:hypothetical protein